MNFRDPSGLTQAGNPIDGLQDRFTDFPLPVSIISQFEPVRLPPVSDQLLRLPPIDESNGFGPNSFGDFGSGFDGSVLLIEGFDFDFSVPPVQSQASTLSRDPFDSLRSLNQVGVRAARGVANGLSQAESSVFGVFDTLAGGIEFATFGGQSSFVAGLGAGTASLVRSVGGIFGGLVNPIGAAEATFNNIGQGIQIGRERGVALGVGHFVGTNALGEAITGVDINTGLPVSRLDKAAEASGRIGGTVLAGTLPFRLRGSNVPSSRPLSMSPLGAERRGAFREAKRSSGIPVSQQPHQVLPNVDRRGNVKPGRVYEFNVPAQGGGTRSVRIREDAAGHFFGPNNLQNRGPHFNDELGNHFDFRNPSLQHL